MRLAFLIVLFSSLLAGCTVTRVTMPEDFSASFEDVNRKLDGRTARIRLFDGSRIQGEEVVFSEDTLCWTAAETEARTCKALDEVEEVSYEKMGRGFFAGAAVGVAAAVAMALTPRDENVPRNSYLGSVTETKTLLATSLGLTSIVLGLLAEGRREYVVFQQPRPRSHTD